MTATLKQMKMELETVISMLQFMVKHMGDNVTHEELVATAERLDQLYVKLREVQNMCLHRTEVLIH